MAIWSKDEKQADPEVTADGFNPDLAEGEVSDNADGLQRHLANRQIQLIAIGGSIGTALFVSIGTALEHGGPGSLFIAYTLYAIVIGLVNNGIAEMTVAFPVSGGFPRLAGHWVDDAWGFMAAWNFFLYEALLIPFEITAFISVASFWSADITNAGPSGGIICGIIICYALINILAVRAYGEAEFWLSGGKVILIFMLFCFTFITMVGGNPQGDAYGFRYWGNGHAFKQYISYGDKGRFEGFLKCLWSASFCIVGPEYMSMVAAEARRPRVYIKTAFKTVYFRFAIFFIGGALAAGIVCASYWPALVNLVEEKTTAAGAGASPYVIAMEHLGIGGLPHLVNALMLTSIFSAGNTYTYCAVRNLYGLALEGRAPKFLAYCTKKGVPLYCFCVVMIFPFLAFLSLGGGGAQNALNWLINITTAGGLVNYIVMCVTYLQFHKACKVQGLDRNSLPYTAYFQPYCAWIGLIFETIVILCYGYSTFRYPPEHWNTTTFFTYYILVILDPILFIFWKLFKRTKWLSPHEIDLVWERPTIDAYEATFIDKPIGFWRELIQLFGVWKQSGGNDKRLGSISN